MNSLASLNHLLVAATGDPTKFQGARFATGKHSRGRIPIEVKSRTNGRDFTARVTA